VRGASADTLVLNGTVHAFYISTSTSYGSYDHVLDAGGDAMGVLNGQTLLGAYCVDLFSPVYVPSSYPLTTVSADGTIYGNAVNNAGQVSWLMKTYAPSATTIDDQNALQASIWRTLYGSGFEVDGADNAKTGNSAAMVAGYQSMIASLGSNTAPISDVLWMSPGTASGPPAPYTVYQGLVGLAPSSAPEPGSLLLFGLGATAFATRRRK
jgi:hypothetical protein